MSGSHQGQGPEIVGPHEEKRGVRRLGGRPMIVAAGAGAAFVAIAGVAIWGHGKRQAATEATEQSTPADASSAVSGIPLNGDIPAAGRPSPIQHAVARTPDPVRPQQPAPAVAAAPQPAQPNPIREQALREAWTAYYQQLAQKRQGRFEADREALTADSAVGQAAGRQGGQGGQGGGVRPASVGGGAGMGQEEGGGVGGGRVQQMRPGSLNQGQSSPATDYLPYTVTPPLSRYELKAGHPIQIRFITGVSSDAPGQFTATVTHPVSDTATGLHVLIPQGARVVGSYDHLQQVGTERLPAGATRIIFPGESSESLDLGSMPLADQAGYSGLRDRMDRHTGRLIFNTALLALGGAGAQLTQPQSSSRGGIDASQILAAQLGLQFGQVGSEYARQQLQVRPTHTIRPGYTATIQLTQDVAFPGEWVEGVGMLPAAAGRAR